jgi:branched-chain amino acid transport system substrate-binding protein
MFVIANAGPHQAAGEMCSPYVFSTSWQNDQTPQAIGIYMNQKGIKSVFLIGPNYAAGKDMLNGVRTTFKGKIVGEELTKWPDQLDFSAELSKVRAANPEAVFVFYPGPAGVQFLNQYVQAGLKGKIPLYTAYTIDALSLPRQGDLALPSSGSTTCRSRRTRSSSPTSRPSTRAIRRSTAPSPMTPPISSTAQWWR